MNIDVIVGIDANTGADNGGRARIDIVKGPCRPLQHRQGARTGGSGKECPARGMRLEFHFEFCR
jgi:hypothetical protein